MASILSTTFLLDIMPIVGFFRFPSACPSPFPTELLSSATCYLLNVMKPTLFWQDGRLKEVISEALAQG
jgi:hypothetical protein